MKTEIMTFDDVVDELKISKHHLRLLVFRKQIPYYKVGRLLRFKRSELDDFFFNKRKKSTNKVKKKEAIDKNTQKQIRKLETMLENLKGKYNDNSN